MHIQNLKNLWQKRNILILIAVIAVLIFNFFDMKDEIHNLTIKNKTKPFVFIGSQFEGLKGHINGASWIGYYTDRSLNDAPVAAQFAQAQYVLAPTLLDLNNTDHALIICDFRNKRHAIKRVQTMGFTPISRSSSGLILARNPRF